MTDGGTSAGEARFLTAFFDALRRRKVPYAVLRNYESLPARMGARDLDLVTPPHSIADVEALVDELALEQQLTIAAYYSDERITQFVLSRRAVSGELLQIKIDLFRRSEVYGAEFMSAEEMLNGRQERNGVWIVAGEVELLDKMAFNLVVGHAVSCKYDRKFQAIALARQQAVCALLGRLVNHDAAGDVYAAIASGAASSVRLSRAQRRSAILRLYRRMGVAGPHRSLAFLFSRLRAWLQPHGTFVSISGPDGCGKTSVIEIVQRELEALSMVGSAQYRHFRPSLLPRIASLAHHAGAIEKVDTDYERPHRAEVSSGLPSLARAAYYISDYVLGYWLSVRPSIARRGTCIFDRYYFDMLADPGRSRIGLSIATLSLLGRVVPKPRHSFYLRVDPEEVVRRKQELSIDKVRELNARYEWLVARGLLTAVDNHGSPASAARRIVDSIVSSGEQLAQRERS